MYYSSIGILASLILLITNYDVLIKYSHKNIMPAHHSYRKFLFSVFAYYVTDLLWEPLSAYKILNVLFVETAVYFVVMAISVFLWTQYVIIYLNEKNRFTKILKYTGILFLILQIVILIINFFIKIAYWFGEDGTYYTGPARDFNLFTQFILFLATTIRMMFITTKTHGKAKIRHHAIGTFGLTMAIFIVLQAIYPLMPFYAIGYMLGTCVLHTFVLEDEKETRQEELEKLLQLEQIQEAELGTARQMAYTDPLTGVKNKTAYMEDICGIEQRIKDKILTDFSLIVFDVNNLKIINDTKGHEEGDNYIISASKMICHEFRNSPVYRIGGDEFVAFLMGEDFKNRQILLENFNKKIEKNLEEGKVVIAFGLEEFKAGEDKTYQKIFERADMKMYKRKKELKNMKIL